MTHATSTRSVRAVAAACQLCLLVALLGCGTPEFDGPGAFEHLERQCSFGPRPPGSEAHEAMVDWLVDTLSGLADEVAVQRFVAQFAGSEVELTNVIASFGVAKRERVLLAAHWDTRAVADRDPDPANRETPILGANDGASGVAVLLELAEMMAEREPAIGVDMVFFDGEDGGDGGGLADWCLGSTYYAARLSDYFPSYAIVIDMIGDADLAIPMEPNSFASNPDQVRRVWDAAERAGSKSFHRDLGKAMFDDHVPLIRARVPSVLIIDAEYRYWHTIEDTPDKCSPASLAEVGRVLVELVY